MPLLVSADAMERAGSVFAWQARGELRVRGKSEPVRLFAPPSTKPRLASSSPHEADETADSSA